MWQQFKNYYHLLQAFFAAVYFGFPSQKIKVIGVTGTDGKTTTVNLIYHILKSTHINVSMVSSVGAKIGKYDYDTGLHVSTPSPWHVQKYLKKAVDTGSKYFVIEATSHGLDQNRLAFVDFEIGILTNITHEHLDYHKNWKQYALSKLILLENSKLKIINLDDNSFKFVRNKIGGEILTYSKEKKADINTKNFHILLNIDGHYNLSNALAACAVATSIGVPKQQILKVISTFKGVKGRFEKIDIGQKFKVFIDFAHTPNGLENVLTSLKSKLKKGGRLIAVFGSAGARDTLKRATMGKVASKIADVIILTSEDPRGEDPQKICQEIAQGVRGKVLNKNYHIIVDRRHAIEFAINMAKDDDIIGLFGKGHERSINIKGEEYPWDEFKVASQALKKRLKV
ncbi:hypothetical protein A3A49_02255 [Candidatus Curtissbacteria bacterium RIFCSPLOWO2_01_FULL_38_11b]|uniref:UDP-N-acetylmuramyl-tripeptide synthetase n=1 Tax=Candidatus Curtissbacteria bacterium RIFCSPLOWO2_01_FULL_38_11b TaxID=1797725 RepID=A0A1F5GZF2_9BACT|nr:MAG: hypothetical protein A3A49_02255 [Candidatus Curtissbacteria bacterium RIFCSPLOWO2_01_FULL_38_11b]